MSTAEQMHSERIKKWCVDHGWLFHAILASLAYFVAELQFGPIMWLASSIAQLWSGPESRLAGVCGFSGLILTACGA